MNWSLALVKLRGHSTSTLPLGLRPASLAMLFLGNNRTSCLSLCSPRHGPLRFFIVVLGPRPTDEGSGKVAGKVLIVDQGIISVKLLI